MFRVSHHFVEYGFRVPRDPEHYIVSNIGSSVGAAYNVEKSCLREFICSWLANAAVSHESYLQMSMSDLYWLDEDLYTFLHSFSLALEDAAKRGKNASRTEIMEVCSFGGFWVRQCLSFWNILAPLLPQLVQGSFWAKRVSSGAPLVFFADNAGTTSSSFGPRCKCEDENLWFVGAPCNIDSKYLA